jgi:hypothetical protein
MRCMGSNGARCACLIGGFGVTVLVEHTPEVRQVEVGILLVHVQRTPRSVGRVEPLGRQPKSLRRHSLAHPLYARTQQRAACNGACWCGEYRLSVLSLSDSRRATGGKASSVVHMLATTYSAQSVV